MNEAGLEQDFSTMEINTMRAKTSKKKRFFNWLDIVILVLLVCAVVCIVFRFNPFSLLSRDDGNTVYAVYTVKITEVRRDFSESIHRGDVVFDDSENAHWLGRVEDVSVEQSVRPGVENGRIVMKAYGDYVDVTLTVRAEDISYLKKEGYSVNGVRLAVGNEKKFVFQSFVAAGVITAMQVFTTAE